MGGRELYFGIELRVRFEVAVEKVNHLSFTTKLKNTRHYGFEKSHAVRHPFRRINHPFQNRRGKKTGVFLRNHKNHDQYLITSNPFQPQRVTYFLYSSHFAFPLNFLSPEAFKFPNKHQPISSLSPSHPSKEKERKKASPQV